MRVSFDRKFTAASAFLIFCSVGACILPAMNAPAASARGAPTEMTDVDRVNKADRLTTSPARQARQKLSPSAESMKTRLQRPPLGCDPAFSPVAEPTRSGIYRRCTV